MTNYKVYTRTEFKFVGRLLAVPTKTNLLNDYIKMGGNPNLIRRGEGTGLASIEFPCMPDEIQLDRRTQYMSLPNMVLPDGLHLYQHTTPLEIPFKFKLFGYDTEYCADGPATLLGIAARLHAFVLPLNPGQKPFSASARFLHANIKSEASTQAEGTATTGKPTAPDPNLLTHQDPIKTTLINQEFIRPPVTCILELMRLSDRSDQMGIHCRGYVKEVSVKLQGPWLRGAGMQFNVPTSAEYGFTFVHVPSHQNDWADTKTSATQNQAFAHDVINKFYNTISLNTVLMAQGFDLADPNQKQPTAQPASTAAPLPPGVPSEEQRARIIRRTEETVKTLEAIKNETLYN